MTDRFSHYNASLESPAGTAFAITPLDGADLTEITRAIYIGQGGDLHVVMLSDAEVVFSNLPAGMLLPCRVRRVLATGSTAGDLVGLA